MANEDIARHKISQESADKRYVADSNLAGTIYSADRGYTGRIDTAYINEYGISKSDAGTIAKGTVDTVTKAGKSLLPTKVGRVTVAAAANPGKVVQSAAQAALGATFGVLNKKKTVKKPLSSKTKKRR
nr:putative ORF1 [Marmot picobirnavirus]